MKKLMFVVIVSVFSIIGYSKSEACPDWATNSQIFLFNVGGCTYAAEICWKCPVNLGQLWVAVDEFKLVAPVPCGNMLTPDEIAEDIYNQINNVAWLLGLCAQSIPPCGQGGLFYSIKKYNCWYMYRNYDGIVEYIVCNHDGYCQQDWLACWDNQWGFVKNPLTGWYQVGSSGCSTIQPGTPENEGEMSSCWDFLPCN